jgi:hypothetical protein
MGNDRKTDWEEGGGMYLFPSKILPDKFHFPSLSLSNLILFTLYPPFYSSFIHLPLLPTRKLFTQSTAVWYEASAANAKTFSTLGQGPEVRAHDSQAILGNMCLAMQLNWLQLAEIYTIKTKVQIILTKTVLNSCQN